MASIYFSLSTWQDCNMMIHVQHNVSPKVWSLTTLYQWLQKKSILTPLQSLGIFFLFIRRQKTSHFGKITQVTVATTVDTVGLILAEIITNWRLAACPSVVITAHSQRLLFHHHTSPSRIAVLHLLARRALRPARWFGAFITSQRFNCKSKNIMDKPTYDENTSFLSRTSESQVS